MPEPDLVEEPRDATVPVLTPAEAVPAPIPAPPPAPTYHMRVWDDPPTYICLTCNAQGVDKPAIVAHLHTAHGLPAIPTLIAHQMEAGILTQTLGLTMPPREPGATPPQEEHADDDRGRTGEQPGDTGDARAPDVSL